MESMRRRASVANGARQERDRPAFAHGNADYLSRTALKTFGGAAVLFFALNSLLK